MFKNAVFAAKLLSAVGIVSLDVLTIFYRQSKDMK